MNDDQARAAGYRTEVTCEFNLSDGQYGTQVWYDRRAIVSAPEDAYRYARTASSRNGDVVPTRARVVDYTITVRNLRCSPRSAAPSPEHQT